MKPEAEKKKIVAAIYLNQPNGKLVEVTTEPSKHRYRKSQGNVSMLAGQTGAYFQESQEEPKGSQ
jgi:hypothetical protein